MASLPPVLMILSFQVLIAIVKWVMLHLGRPLNSAAALTPTTPLPGYGLAPPPSPYGLFPPHLVYGQMPSSIPSENYQNGHGASGNGDQADALKRHQVEAYLAALSAQQLDQLTAREVAETLKAQGLEVSERYVAQLLDQWNARRRGSGERKKSSR